MDSILLFLATISVVALYVFLKLKKGASQCRKIESNI